MFWKETTLWHWEFWVSSFLIVGPWIIWFLFRKRGSEGRQLLAGCFVCLISSFLDFTGVAYGAWFYTGKALPFIPTFLPWDFSLLPVTVMLWLQFKPCWHPFLKAVLYASLVAWIGEPFFVWLGLYKPIHWSSLASFPVYISIYLLSYRLTKLAAFDVF